MKNVRDTSEGQSKSKHNTFRAEVACPACKKKSEIAFKAEVGPLEWRDFKVGDELKARGKAAYAPAPECAGKSFWASGIGSCHACRADICARIEIRKNRFDKADVIALPPDAKMVDFLADWGFL